MKQLISVIVPIYNVEKYLRKCVDSILNQTYKNLEIILVDDGSPDGSPAICDEYAKKDSRVVVIHKKNAGVSAARNSGLEKATGDYVAFVDGDDYIDERMYEKLLEKAEQDNLDMCVCYYNKVEETTGQIKFVNERHIEDIKTEKVFASLIKVGSFETKTQFETENIMGCVWRTLYKRELVGNVRFDSNLSIGEDLIFNLELFEKKPKVDIVSEPLYFYIQRTTSAVHAYSKTKIEKRLAMHKHLLEVVKNHVSDEEYKWHQFHIYAGILNELMKHGQKKYVKTWANDEFMKSLYSRETYRCAKKLCKVFHFRVAYFFIYHKWYSLYCLVLKVI